MNGCDTMNRKDKKYLLERADILEQYARNLERNIDGVVKTVTVPQALKNMASEMKTRAGA